MRRLLHKGLIHHVRSHSGYLDCTGRRNDAGCSLSSVSRSEDHRISSLRLCSVVWWRLTAPSYMPVVGIGCILYRMFRHPHWARSFINGFPISSEPEAAAVHCALWGNLQLKPNQSFMVCDAGGGTIVRLLLCSPFHPMTKKCFPRI